MLKTDKDGKMISKDLFQYCKLIAKYNTLIYGWQLSDL